MIKKTKHFKITIKLGKKFTHNPQKQYHLSLKIPLLPKTNTFLSVQNSDALRQYNNIKLSLSRETTPLIRPLFHCRRDGLIRGDYCNTIIEYNKDSILQSKKSGNMKCINLISSMMLRVINKYIQAKQNKLNVLKRVQQYL